MASPTDNPSEHAGIDFRRVTAWLAANVSRLGPIDSIELVAGGRSNLTYVVRDTSGTAVVLRRPPLGDLAATAHDVLREHRVMTALQRSGVPVPQTLGATADTSITGAPFYVMSHVEGHILRQADDSEKMLTSDGRRALGPAIARTLAALQAVDLDESGLADQRRGSTYTHRQLRRWRRRLDDLASSGGLPVDTAVALHERLQLDIPDETEAVLLHGDFRPENMIVDSSGAVAAVLDWELCTVGDPRADLAYLAVEWSKAFGDTPATTTTEMISAYVSASGRPWPSRLNWFCALASWRTACLARGLQARQSDRHALEPTTDFDFVEVIVASELAAARYLDLDRTTEGSP